MPILRVFERKGLVSDIVLIGPSLSWLLGRSLGRFVRIRQESYTSNTPIEAIVWVGYLNSPTRIIRGREPVFRVAFE